MWIELWDVRIFRNCRTLNQNRPLWIQSTLYFSGSSLKRIGEEEGTKQGEYAWNWDKPGGGVPWKDDDKDLLSTSDKTHLLRNAYAANIKRAVQSLEAQRHVPGFPPLLWRDVLAN